MKYGPLAVGLIVVVAIVAVAITCWDPSQDDDLRDPVIGDVVRYEYDYHDGDIEEWAYQIIGTYDDVYVIELTNKLNGEVISTELDCTLDFMHSALGWDTAMEYLVGTETISTINGDVECNIYEYEIAGIFYQTYIDSDGIMYLQHHICEDCEWTATLKENTLFGESSDVEPPGVEMPVFSEVEIIPPEPGDIIEYYLYRGGVESYTTYSVTDVSGNLVTYEIDGDTHVCTTLGFLDLVETKEDYDMESLTYNSSYILEGNNGSFIIDEYYVEYITENGPAYDDYYFEHSSGMLITYTSEIRDERKDLTELYMMGFYTDGVSDIPRTVLVPGDTVSYTSTYTYDDERPTEVVLRTITHLGYFEGMNLIQQIYTDNGEASTHYQFFESLEDWVTYDVEDYTYMGTEVITTVFGDIECEVYHIDEEYRENTVYLTENGFIVYQISVYDGYTKTTEVSDLSLCTAPSLIPAPEIEIPDFVKLEWDDELEVGDTITFSSSLIESTPTYTVMAIEDGIVTYDADGDVRECTIEEFRGFVKTIDDFDLDEMIFRGMALETSDWGMIPAILYLDENGDEYYFDYSSGVLFLYCDMGAEASYRHSTSTSMIDVVSGDIVDQRDEAVIGDTIVSSFYADPEDIWTSSMVVVDTYDDRYVVEVTYTSENGWSYSVLQVHDAFSTSEPIGPSGGTFVGTEIIDTCLGYVLCDVYTTVYNDMTYILYCTPNGDVYRTISVSDGVITYDIVSNTLLYDSGSVVDPGIGPIDISNIVIDERINPGDTVVIYDSELDGEQIYTVLAVSEGWVTYDLNGVEERCAIGEFLDLIQTKDDFDLENLSYYRSDVITRSDNGWGNIIVDIYLSEEIIDGVPSENVYLFETTSGLLITTYHSDGTMTEIVDTSLCISYVDGMSDTPRVNQVVGDVSTYAISGDTDMVTFTSTVIGYIEGQQVLEEVTVYKDGTQDISYYIPGNTENWIDLRNGVKVGTETIMTFRGEIECDVYQYMYAGALNELYIGPDLVEYRIIDDKNGNACTYDLVSTTQFTDPDLIPAVDRDFPVPDMLVFKDTVEAGDRFVLGNYYGALETYTVISVEGDTLIYEMNGTSVTTTVSGFMDCIPTKDDYPMDDLTYTHSYIWNIGLGTTVLECYYGPNDETYWFDACLGVLWYIHAEDYEWAYMTECSLVTAIPADAPDVRTEPVIGDTTVLEYEYLFASSSITSQFTVTFVGTYDGMDMTGVETSSGSISYQPVQDYYESFAYDLSRYEYIFSETIRTPFGYIPCEVYVNEDKGYPDLAYVASNGLVYRCVLLQDYYTEVQNLISSTLFDDAEDVPGTDIPLPEIIELVIDNEPEVGDIISYEYGFDDIVTCTVTNVTGSTVTVMIEDRTEVYLKDRFIDSLITLDDYDSLIYNSMIVSSVSEWEDVILDVYYDKDGNRYTFEHNSKVLTYGQYQGETIYLDHCDLLVPA